MGKYDDIILSYKKLYGSDSITVITRGGRFLFLHDSLEGAIRRIHNRFFYSKRFNPNIYLEKTNSNELISLRILNPISSYSYNKLKEIGKHEKIDKHYFLNKKELFDKTILIKVKIGTK